VSAWPARRGVSERLEAAAFTALAPVEELLPSGPPVEGA
jgi:hypothetical protein